MKTKYLILLLFIISTGPLLDFFHPGLPITHDGQDHVARIANFYQNLQEGNIIPRWAGNLNWGYGHPILMFLYPLPSYTVSLFHFLGFSLVDSLKIVFGLAFIVSGLFMFLWLREFLADLPAFVGGMLYMFAPYRFVDLYVRGAIGEHVAFVFPPLICYFLLKLSQIPPPRSPSPLRQSFAGRVGHLGGVLKGLPRGGFWYIAGGSLSLAGLILSHNAISLIFAPIMFIYTLYLLWQSHSKKLLVISYWLLVMLGFGISAFFWMPAFFEGKYTLRDIVTTGEYASRFVTVQSLVFGEWNYGGSGQFTTQVGTIHWLLVLAALPAVVVLKRKKKYLWMLSVVLLLIFAATLFLMTKPSFLIWEVFTTLQKFQFPWRLLSVTVFTTAVLGGIVCSVLPKSRQTVVCCFLFVALFVLNKDYWQANGYLIKDESFFTNIYYGTTDTGESSPIWSVRFMEKTPGSKIELINGEGSIKEIARSSTVHKYEIEAKERVRIRENTLYFPGWEVLVDGKVQSIEFQDPANRGLITFFVESGKHLVQLKFGETRLRQAANLISAGTILLLIATPHVWKRFLPKKIA